MHGKQTDDADDADKDVVCFRPLARPSPSFLFCDGMQHREGVKTRAYFGLSQSASEKLCLMLQMIVRKCELSLGVNLIRISGRASVRF